MAPPWMGKECVTTVDTAVVIGEEVQRVEARVVVYDGRADRILKVLCNGVDVAEQLDTSACERICIDAEEQVTNCEWWGIDPDRVHDRRRDA